MPITINEATALRVQIDLVIDRDSGDFRWLTHGMSSPHDIKEQDAIFRTLRHIVNLSLAVTASESQTVN